MFLSFDTIGQALKCFNENIETRRRSHVDGQVWSVTLYDMELCEKLGIGRVPQGTMLSYVKTGERVYAMPTHTFIENATMIETTEEM
jgi:hypothetical protein